MKCTGMVTRGGDVALIVVEKGACGDCHACGVANLAGETTHEVTAHNRVGAKIGDRVSLELSERKVLKASAISFGVPFVAFICGTLLGYYLISPLTGLSEPLAALIVAAVLLACSFFPVRWLGDREEFEFRITGIDDEG